MKINAIEKTKIAEYMSSKLIIRVAQKVKKSKHTVIQALRKTNTLSKPTETAVLDACLEVLESHSLEVLDFVHSKASTKT